MFNVYSYTIQLHITKVGANMLEAKTVSSSINLYSEQIKDVENMRNCLLSIDKTDPNAFKKAILNTTLLRVYHQLERIIRYTELMDKIEDRIYQSIEMKLDNADPDDEDIWQTLIPIQERLQRSMIESHKLLEPYLNMEQLSSLEVVQEQDPADSFTSMILDQEARERVRTGAQQLLAVISSMDENNSADSGPSNSTTDDNTIQPYAQPSIQDAAQAALAALNAELDSELAKGEDDA